MGAEPPVPCVARGRHGTAHQHEPRRARRREAFRDRTTDLSEAAGDRVHAALAQHGRDVRRRERRVLPCAGPPLRPAVGDRRRVSARRQFRHDLRRGPIGIRPRLGQVDDARVDRRVLLRDDQAQAEHRRLVGIGHLGRRRRAQAGADDGEGHLSEARAHHALHEASHRVEPARLHAREAVAARAFRQAVHEPEVHDPARRPRRGAEVGEERVVIRCRAGINRVAPLAVGGKPVTRGDGDHRLAVTLEPRTERRADARIVGEHEPAAAGACGRSRGRAGRWLAGVPLAEGRDRPPRLREPRGDVARLHERPRGRCRAAGLDPSTAAVRRDRSAAARGAGVLRRGARASRPERPQSRGGQRLEHGLEVVPVAPADAAGW